LALALSLDVGEVGINGCRRGGGGDRRRERRLPLQMRAHLEQGGRGQHPHTGNQSAFGRALRRQHEAASRVARAARHGERTAHRAQLARERELARELVRIELRGGQLTGRSEDAERDRQVEAAAFLRQLGRREIDRDPPRRELEAAVRERSAHAFAAFLHLRLREPDDGEAGEPGPDVHLDVDRGGVEPGERPAAHDRKRHQAGVG
jgi:hypothetical protein